VHTQIQYPISLNYSDPSRNIKINNTLQDILTENTAYRTYYRA